MRSRGEKGAALIWALMLLVVASTFGAALLDRGRAVEGASRDDLAELKALYAAEGGLEFARHALAQDQAYRGGHIRVGECEVTITVKPTDNPERRQVTATASPGGIQVTAVLEFAKDPTEPPRVVAWEAR